MSENEKKAKRDEKENKHMEGLFEPADGLELIIELHIRHREVAVLRREFRASLSILFLHDLGSLLKHPFFFLLIKTRKTNDQRRKQTRWPCESFQVCSTSFQRR